MSCKGETLLERLITSIAYHGNAQTTISAKEYADCPELMQALINTKLAAPCEPSQTIECEGCEESCFMPVEIPDFIG